MEIPSSRRIVGSDFDSEQTTTLLSETVASTLTALLNIDHPVVGTGVIGFTTLFQPADGGGIPGTNYTLADGTGTGGFIVASEGILEVGVTGAQNCERPYNAWPGAEPNQFRMPSRTGYLTVAAIWCDAE